MLQEFQLPKVQIVSLLSRWWKVLISTGQGRSNLRWWWRAFARGAAAQ